jgi:hypothetical protein
MKTNLEQVTVLPKSGDERFHASNATLEFSLKDFWIWGVSDLICNLTRGHLAEFIVGKAIGSPGYVRNEWAAYDLLTRTGIKLEVKSSAYLQSWMQTDYSAIQFNVEKTKELDLVNGGYRGEPRRCADIYVFALLAHRDKATVDALNVKQWGFYVLPTSILNERLQTQFITLKTLVEWTGGPVDYFGLDGKISQSYPKQISK